MDVDLIFKIAAIGIIVAVLNQLLVRSGREEQAMMTTLAGLIVVLMMIIQQIDVLFRSIKSIFGLCRCKTSTPAGRCRDEHHRHCGSGADCSDSGRDT